MIREQTQKQAETYSPKLCEKLLSYFYDAKPEVAYDEEYFPSGEPKRKKPVTFPPQYPTLARFARQNGLTVSILKQWQSQYPEFAAACAEAAEAQKTCIITNALSREFDAGFSKFLLCAIFGEEFSKEGDPPENPELDVHITYGKERETRSEHV